MVMFVGQRLPLYVMLVCKYYIGTLSPWSCLWVSGSDCHCLLCLSVSIIIVSKCHRHAQSMVMFVCQRLPLYVMLVCKYYYRQ